MWDVTDLYASPEGWAVEYDRIKARPSSWRRTRARLAPSAAQMRQALDAISRVTKEASRLYTYASLKADEDLSNSRNQERRQQAGALNTLLEERRPGWRPKFSRWAPTPWPISSSEDAELASPARLLPCAIFCALRPHTLGLEAESVLAAAGDILQQPDSVYGQLANSDLPYPMVKLSDGTEVRLDQPAYEQYRQSPNRADRKLVFDAFWGAWKNFESTDGAILTAGVMGNVFRARARKYPNALAAALFPDTMPESVYRTLVAQANAGCPRCIAISACASRLLGIHDELQYYDVYPSMFPGRNVPKFTIAEFGAAVACGLAPYGAEYLRFPRSRVSPANGRIPFPRPHKASGAYMNGNRL